MAQLYEGMFLIDNDKVRAGWSSAKALALGVLEKHGAKVHSARRWGERKLAYPVRGRRRATYLLAYYEVPSANIPAMVRELDLSESVLRYLLVRADQVPAGELELAATEAGADYVVPTPPSDEAGSYYPLQGEGLEPAEGERGVDTSDEEEIEIPEELSEKAGA